MKGAGLTKAFFSLTGSCVEICELRFVMVREVIDGALAVWHAGDPQRGNPGLVGISYALWGEKGLGKLMVK